jgi:small subunit ribosomal protein S17
MADKTDAKQKKDAVSGETETAVEETVAEVVAEPEPDVAAEAASEPEAPATEAAPEPEAAPAEAAAPAVVTTGPKPKKKRLPRAQRPTRSKPAREKPATRRPIVRLDKPEHERGRRQERQGTVVSDAMEKTIVVKVEVLKAHPKYQKVVRRSTKFHAHDERGEAKVGDVVRIVETRPLSKTKRWRLAEVVEAAK